MRTQTNSIIRALTLLDILKRGSDENHKMSQQELLTLMKRKDGKCTEKTLRTDLINLMGILNPPVSEYGEKKDEFRIIYDGIEEGRNRKTGLQYIHAFTNDDLELLLELVQQCAEIEDWRRARIIENLKELGSRHYTYQTEMIRAIPEYVTRDFGSLRSNIKRIAEAIKLNCQLSFTFNKYGKDSLLVPVRTEKYIVNPYYIVKYGSGYYLLASHGKSEKTYIYRLDLMTDIETVNKQRESVRGVKELNNSDAIKYMKRHLYMNYDEPRTIVIKLGKDYYTYLHDAFGSNYKYKGEMDENFDEIEVVCSENAMINWAMQHHEHVEIIRPASAREKIMEKAEEMIKKYKKI